MSCGRAPVPSAEVSRLSEDPLKFGLREDAVSDDDSAMELRQITVFHANQVRTDVHQVGLG
jgi:hypothetical protein